MRLYSCLLSLVATIAVVNAAPVFDNFSTPAEDDFLESVVPGEYLVTLEPNTDLDHHTEKLSKLLDSSSGSRLLNTFVISNFKCHHIHTTDNEVLKSIAAMKEVTTIEPNWIVTAAICSSHDTANWGLTRINFNRIPNYSVERKYHYDSDGSGATIYLLDSGVKKSLPHFTSAKVYYGKDFIDSRGPHEQQNTDESGHGTGLAATLVAPCCGIAKQAVLVDVRILNENNKGSIATTIQALEYVKYAQESSQAWPNQPAIINLSIEGKNVSNALDSAIENVYHYHHITVVAASGNKRRNACLTSPARAHFAITAGATDKSDRFWYPSSGTRGSNYGSCVNILAPGVQVTVPSLLPAGVIVATGTSISAAFVSGSLARFVSSGTLGRPAHLRNALMTRGSYSAGVTNLQPWTPDRLLHMECV